MFQNEFECIDGKAINILNMIFEFSDELNLTLICLVDNKKKRIDFKNVSAVNIKDACCPLFIYGFEVIDNQTRGWEERTRYTIRDFENGAISFFCQEITIVP